MTDLNYTDLLITVRFLRDKARRYEWGTVRTLIEELDTKLVSKSLDDLAKFNQENGLYDEK